MSSAGSWDFRVGAQQIIWGEVVGLFFADVVSAKDMREFLLPSFEIIRIPQWAARAEYFAGDSHLELVWIPVPVFDRIGKPGADFYPAPLPSPTPASVAALFLDPDRPDRNLGNSNYGVRGNTLVSGWDLAAFYYRSSSTQPTFYRMPSATPGQPFVFQPRYDRIWQAGGTVSKDLGEVVLRGEAVYANGQGYSVTDLSVPQGVVKRNTLDYIVSVEFSLPGDTRVNLQGFQRAVFGGGANDFVIKSDGFGASIFVSTKLIRRLRAPGALDPEFQGRGRHGPAATQLVSRQEHGSRLRCRYLYRAERRVFRPLQQPRPRLFGTPLRLLECAPAVRRPLRGGRGLSGDSKQDRRQQGAPGEGSQAAAQHAHFHVQQHRGRLDALAERLSRHCYESQNARIECNVPRIDLDENVGHAMQRIRLPRRRD